MPQCPTCRSPLQKWLAVPSAAAVVDYYHCLGCGHVWTTKKATETSAGDCRLTILSEPQST